MTEQTTIPFQTLTVLDDVYEERLRQDEKWGEQHHPDGTGSTTMQFMAHAMRSTADAVAETGDISWLDILREEVYEALAESDLTRLREELVQVAAVCVNWIEDIDSRGDDGRE